VAAALRFACHHRRVRNADIRVAAELLRTIVAKIESRELTGSKRVVARLEGAATALEALSRARRT
jgi:hypothetical protein